MLPYTLLLTPHTPLPDHVEIDLRARNQLQVTLTPGEAAALSDLPGVTLRPAWIATPKAVQTEGYATLFADGDWQEAGWTGKGVRIAVLDVGFADAEALLDSELPADLTLPSDPGSSSHGTAVAEIIHDIAPGAELMLLRLSTDTEFLAAVDDAIEAEADIICAAIGFDNIWPADGSSPVSLAVTDAEQSHGILWVAAAGNEAQRYQQGPLHRIDGSDIIEIEGVDSLGLAGSQPSVRLRWSEPMTSASADLQLRLVDADGTVCGTSEDVQDGDDAPLEEASSGCGDGAVSAEIYASDSVSVEGLTGHLYAPGGWVVSSPQEGTLTLPADAEGAIAVGACELESGAPGYSSRGPTEDGRLKPDVCAPHGVSTAALAGVFDGTSSSAPHVAGLLALLVESEGLIGASEGRSALGERAVDLGDVGEDVIYGAGLVQGGVPPERRCGCQSSGGTAWWWVVGLFGCVCRRLTV
jgi:subtilisin family serine protease